MSKYGKSGSVLHRRSWRWPSKHWTRWPLEAENAKCFSSLPKVDGWMDGWMHCGCCSHKAVEESLFRPKWTQVTSTNFLFQLSIKQVTAMSPDSLTNHILIVAAVAWGANHRKRLLDEGWMTKTGFIIRLAWWSARLMQDAEVDAFGFESCL